MTVASVMEIDFSPRLVVLRSWRQIVANTAKIAGMLNQTAGDALQRHNTRTNSIARVFRLIYASCIVLERCYTLSERKNHAKSRYVQPEITPNF